MPDTPAGGPGIWPAAPPEIVFKDLVDMMVDADAELVAHTPRRA